MQCFCKSLMIPEIQYNADDCLPWTRESEWVVRGDPEGRTSGVCNQILTGQMFVVREVKGIERPVRFSWTSPLEMAACIVCAVRENRWYG